ncbi:D-alanyl-D-alanine carboxypeptidase family protein [Phreatobacter aquaticus]|uniref:D-alanyl-D-alanine carboxypeptidase family protein n=1 Tax=Phreatobacter aquaticus TaxID=2570229 RepID=UPI00208F6314|nr:D-alanyl-D-alanine carboxypeptidase family protein [Phreatobacter aquaticus]
MTFAGLFVPLSHARAQEAFQTSVRNAILVDVGTESVLFEKAADELQAPASLAKLMTLAVVFEEMRQGRLAADQEVVISQDAWRRGGAPSRTSSMYVAVNSRVKVQDLIRGAIIQSGNDASIALAEAISGTEANFVPLLTRRARDLGLTRSVFRNATGLPDPEQRSTARELAKIADHIIRTYPEQYRIYGEREFTWNNIRQQNRNPLLGTYTGADGLKTGYIEEAGFNLAGSAVQNGQRLIVIVMGARSLQERSNEARKLLDWGFRSFELRELFSEGEVLESVNVFGGAASKVPVTANRLVRLLLPRGQSDRVSAQIVYRGPIRAPIAAGTEVGKLRVLRGSQLALEIPVYAAESVEVGTLTQRAMQGALELASGWLRTGLSRP